MKTKILICLLLAATGLSVHFGSNIILSNLRWKMGAPATPATPPYAASTQTWTFGSSTLTWSDAIHIPACNQWSFSSSDAPPQCRSYTYEGKTYYYYNWPYVDANKTTLCPDPWHVPTSDDFAALVDNTDAAMLESTWGYGGYAYGSYIYDGSTYAYYWSSTEYSSGSYDAYGLGYGSSYLGAGYYTPKHLGFQVRCVK